MTYSRIFDGKIEKCAASHSVVVTTAPGVAPEMLLHIDHTGRYVLNGLGQCVGTLVYETADPTDKRRK